MAEFSKQVSTANAYDDFEDQISKPFSTAIDLKIVRWVSVDSLPSTQT